MQYKIDLKSKEIKRNQIKNNNRKLIQAKNEERNALLSLTGKLIYFNELGFLEI